MNQLLHHKTLLIIQSKIVIRNMQFTPTSGHLPSFVSLGQNGSQLNIVFYEWNFAVCCTHLAGGRNLVTVITGTC